MVLLGVRSLWVVVDWEWHWDGVHDLLRWGRSPVIATIIQAVFESIDKLIQFGVVSFL
jgi:hypothetical protein